MLTDQRSVRVYKTSFLRALGPSTPTYLFPAMNTLMWMHPLTSQHIHFVSNVLRYDVVGPIAKRLACGDVGQGAMVEYTDIIQLIVRRYGLGLQQPRHVHGGRQNELPPPLPARAPRTGERFTPRMLPARACVLGAEKQSGGGEATAPKEEQGKQPGKDAKDGGGKKDTRSTVLQMYGPPPDDDHPLAPTSKTDDGKEEPEFESPPLDDDEQSHSPPPLPSRSSGGERIAGAE